METLITIVQQYAEWIYAICGFAALYNIYQTWQIRAARRQAVFTLERQKAVDDLYKILFTAFVLLGVMGVTYFSSTVLAKAYGLPTEDRPILDSFRESGGISSADSGVGIQSADGGAGDSAVSGDSGDAGDDSGAGDGTGQTTTNSDATASDAENSGGESGTGAGDNETNTDDQTAGSQTGSANSDNRESTTDQNSNESDGPVGNLATPTIPSAVSVGALPAPTQPLPTPTFTYAPPTSPPPPPPPPTITPTRAPAVSPPGCPDPRTNITSPGNGAIVTGSFNLVGTVNHEQMQFYKIEYVPGTNTNQEFVYLSGGNDAINGGVLATVDSTIWYNGTWTIKVTVVDNTGNFPPPCTVTITVSN